MKPKEKNGKTKVRAEIKETGNECTRKKKERSK
jgi:hypothetical protein